MIFFNNKHVSGILIAVFLVMGLFFIQYGRIFLDAGFYLDAASRVWHGDMLYHDFFFVQGPVYPYVYGFFFLFTPATVLTGRGISLIFGLITLFLTARLARKLAGQHAVPWAIAGLALSAEHAYFFSSVKLYALTGMLLTASILVLFSRASPRIRYPLAAIFMVAAAGTRLTILPAALVFLLYMIFDGWKAHRTAMLGGIIAAALAGAALALPFLITDPEAVMYNLIKIHVSAESGPFVFGLADKFKVLVKIALVYPVIGLGVILTIREHLLDPGKKIADKQNTLLVLLIGIITAVHISANWFSVGYESVVMPLVAVWTAGALSRLRSRFSPAIAVGLGLISISCFTWQDIPSFSKPTLRQLHEIGRFIAEKTPPTASIAACNGVFALEAGRKNLPPFGGAPFTFTPGWTDAECKRFGGVNPHLMINIFRNKTADMLIFEPQSFSVGFPGFYPVDKSVQHALFDAIHASYTPLKKFPNTGNGEMTLTVFVRRGEVL